MLVARRAFLTGIASALFAPSVVRASSLMPVSNLKLFPRIGDIKPIVGAIPEGWLECNGRWIVGMSELEKHLLRKHAEMNVGGTAVCLPNLTCRADADRESGKIVGRYVIYGGQQAIDKTRRLSSMMDSMWKTEGDPYYELEEEVIYD